jgi:hypothetical protein
MSTTPQKAPVMTRLGRHLEKHGLSFGDALNIALFALTIASLYLAYQAVRIAKETLDDARIQATQAAKDAAQAAKNQDAQFQKQMEQLRVASDAMKKTSTLLRSQSHILRNLQDISRQQLNDLNATEARIEKQEKASPAPSIWGACNGEVFSKISQEDFGDRYLRTSLRAATLKVPQAGILECSVGITNEGNLELQNASASIFIYPTQGHPCSGMSFVNVNGSDIPPEARVTIIDPKSLAPWGKIQQRATRHVSY